MSEGQGTAAEAPCDLLVVRVHPCPLMPYREKCLLTNRAKYVLQCNVERGCVVDSG